MLSVRERYVATGMNLSELNRYAQWVSILGGLELLKYLESLGADLHADSDGCARRASHNGHLEIVRYLVTIGADIRVCGDECVFKALANGHLETVRYLVSVGLPESWVGRERSGTTGSASGRQQRSRPLRGVGYTFGGYRDAMT